MRINLQCPYSEKDAAKSLGARWDAGRKTWFIVDVEDLTPFMRWIKTETPHPPKTRSAKPAFVTIGKMAPTVFPDEPYPPWEDAPDVESIRILRSL